MVYTSEPENFNPKFEIVACFLLKEEKFLLLKRHKDKPQGGEWGVPAGKVHDGESIEEACVREVEEETGLKVQAPELVGKYYQKYPDYDFVLYVFKTRLESEADVVLNKEEHSDFKWVTSEGAKKFSLMLDLDEVIGNVYKIQNK